MKRKAVVAFATATAVAVAVALSSCSSPTASSTTPANGPVKSIYFANVLPSYPPLAEASKCFLAEAKKLGVKAATGGPSGTATNNQYDIDRISQAVADGYTAIVAQPIDGAAYTPILKQVKAKGLYLATMNTGETTTMQNFTIGTDYTSQGATVAKAIGERSGQQYVGIIGPAAGGTNTQFLDGFKKGISSQNLSNVTYVDNEFDQGDPTKTADVVEQMLTAHPNINVVLSWEGAAAPGIITAITEKGLTGKVVGVTNDVTDQVTAGIKSGVLYGTSEQNFCKMGTEVVDNLVALGKGKTVTKSVDTGITFVTKDNLSEVTN